MRIGGNQELVHRDRRSLSRGRLEGGSKLEEGNIEIRNTNFH